MTGALNTRFACVLAAALIGLVGSATRSVAADQPPDAQADFPAGVACDFPLHVDMWNNPNYQFRTFYDRNGNVVRYLFAGRGSALTFTNLTNSKTLSLKANGSVNHIDMNPDGSSTQALTGHNVLILYPTDVPAGPSTTLYVGRAVFTSDAAANYTLQSVSGTSTDICAALR